MLCSLVHLLVCLVLVDQVTINLDGLVSLPWEIVRYKRAPRSLWTLFRLREGRGNSSFFLCGWTTILESIPSLSGFQSYVMLVENEFSLMQRDLWECHVALCVNASAFKWVVTKYSEHLSYAKIIHIIHELVWEEWVEYCYEKRWDWYELKKLAYVHKIVRCFFS